MLAQVGLEHGGKRDDAPSGSGLRRAEDRSAAPLFNELTVYPDGASIQVNVTGT
jgi:hypothetical protein